MVAATVAQLHQAVYQFGLPQICLQGLPEAAQFEHLHHNTAPHGVMQESCQQLEWARRGGNLETTASDENGEILHVVELKSPGQPSLGTAVVTCLLLATSFDKVVVEGLKLYEQPEAIQPVLTLSVLSDRLLDDVGMLLVRSVV